jgi:hypothetical protein
MGLNVLNNLTSVCGKSQPHISTMASGYELLITLNKNDIEVSSHPDETYPELIHRLLDNAAEKTASTTAAAAENRI